MKKPAKKIKTFLKGTSGESLMEALVSILVFSVLIASVTMMIMLSLRITSISTETGNQRQEEARALLTGASAGDISVGVDTGAVSLRDSSTGRTITIPVFIFSTDDFTDFDPEAR